MSAGQMPTEIEAIASNLHEVAEAHAVAVSLLPEQVAAMLNWSVSQEQAESLRQLVWGLSHKARLLQFGLERVHALAASLADEDRTLFSQTVQMVDMCRWAKGTPTNGPEPHQSTVGLANSAEEVLANMQAALRQRFSSEEFPGD